MNDHSPMITKVSFYFFGLTQTRSRCNSWHITLQNHFEQSREANTAGLSAQRNHTWDRLQQWRARCSTTHSVEPACATMLGPICNSAATLWGLCFASQCADNVTMWIVFYGILATLFLHRCWARSSFSCCWFPWRTWIDLRGNISSASRKRGDQLLLGSSNLKRHEPVNNDDRDRRIENQRIKNRVRDYRTTALDDLTVKSAFYCAPQQWNVKLKSVEK